MTSTQPQNLCSGSPEVLRQRHPSPPGYQGRVRAPGSLCTATLNSSESKTSVCLSTDLTAAFDSSFKNTQTKCVIWDPGQNGGKSKHTYTSAGQFWTKIKSYKITIFLVSTTFGVKYLTNFRIRNEAQLRRKSIFRFSC